MSFSLLNSISCSRIFETLAHLKSFSGSIARINQAKGQVCSWTFRLNNQGKYARQLQAILAVFRRCKENETMEKVLAFVDTFYNLVKNTYKWGWGPSVISFFSFHFWKMASTVVCMSRWPLKSWMWSLGSNSLCRMVVGPMHEITSQWGANMVGITIKYYQVNLAKTHKKKAGLDKQCEV